MYCPSCEGEIEFPEDAIGQVVACPHCELDIALAPDTPSPAPPRRASGGKSKVGLIAAVLVVVAGLVTAGVIYGPNLLKGSRMSTPDGAILAVAEGLANNDAGVLWDAMPVAYQEGVNDLVHQYANAVDPKVWDRSFALNSRLLGVLESKKEFIFNSPMVANLPNKEEVMKSYDSVIDLMTVLLKSDLSKLENLKTLDMGDYLDTTGSKVLKEVSALFDAVSNGSTPNPWQELGKMTVKVVKKDKRTATLEIDIANLPPMSFDVVKIDARWVPARMSDVWFDGIMMAEQSVAQMKEQSGAVAAQMNMVFGMAEGMLAQFENAKSQKEFDDALQGVMALAGGFGGNGMGGGFPKK